MVEHEGLLKEMLELIIDNQRMIMQSLAWKDEPTSELLLRQDNKSERIMEDIDLRW